MLSENDLELISAYLDGALSESERTALEARLQTDAELRHELARLRATVDLIKTLPTLSPPRPLTLTPRMVRRPSRWVSASFSALSAAAAAILLILGAALFSVSVQQQAPILDASVARSVAALPTETSIVALGVTQTNAKLGGSTAEENLPPLAPTQAAPNDNLPLLAPTQAAPNDNLPQPATQAEPAGQTAPNGNLLAAPSETLDLNFSVQSPTQGAPNGNQALPATQAEVAGQVAQNSNSPQSTTQTELAGQANDSLLAAPSGTIEPYFSAQSPTQAGQFLPLESEMSLATAAPTASPQALAALASPPALQQAAPMTMSDASASNGAGSAAGAAAPAAAAIQPSETSSPTDTATLTPTNTATNTASPSLTNTPTLTNTPSPTATDTVSPTPTATPAPIFSLPESAETSTVGIGLIVVAVLLFAVAVVTTILRRRA